MSEKVARISGCSSRCRRQNLTVAKQKRLSLRNLKWCIGCIFAIPDQKNVVDSNHYGVLMSNIWLGQSYLERLMKWSWLQDALLIELQGSRTFSNRRGKKLPWVVAYKKLLMGSSNSAQTTKRMNSWLRSMLAFESVRWCLSSFLGAHREESSCIWLDPGNHGPKGDGAPLCA